MVRTVGASSPTLRKKTLLRDLSGKGVTSLFQRVDIFGRSEHESALVGELRAREDPAAQEFCLGGVGKRLERGHDAQLVAIVAQIFFAGDELDGFELRAWGEDNPEIRTALDVPRVPKLDRASAAELGASCVHACVDAGVASEKGREALARSGEWLRGRRWRFLGWFGPGSTDQELHHSARRGKRLLIGADGLGLAALFFVRLSEVIGNDRRF